MIHTSVQENQTVKENHTLKQNQTRFPLLPTQLTITSTIYIIEHGNIKRILASSTHLTLMWPFPCMGPHVAVEFPRVFEGAITDITFVRALLGVDTAVNVQVFFDTKRLVAEFAPVE